MLDETLDNKEMAVLAELEKYENKWVAIHKEDGGEIIVGSGDDAVEAKREAEANGFANAVLMKVRSFDSGYVPTMNA